MNGGSQLKIHKNHSRRRENASSTTKTHFRPQFAERLFIVPRAPPWRRDHTQPLSPCHNPSQWAQIAIRETKRRGKKERLLTASNMRVQWRALEWRLHTELFLPRTHAIAHSHRSCRRRIHSPRSGEKFNYSRRKNEAERKCGGRRMWDLNVAFWRCGGRIEEGEPIQELEIRRQLAHHASMVSSHPILIMILTWIRRCSSPTRKEKPP